MKRFHSISKKKREKEDVGRKEGYVVFIRKTSNEGFSVNSSLLIQ